MDNEDRAGGISLLEDIVQKWHTDIPVFVYNRVCGRDAPGNLQKPHLGKMATAFDVHPWKKKVDVSQSKSFGTLEMSSQREESTVLNNLHCEFNW